MTRNSASRETIDVLINNAKSTMSYSEQLLQKAELIKSKFSEHHITHYLQLLFELLSGSLSAIYGAQNETYIEGWEKKMSNLLIYKRLCKI